MKHYDWQQALIDSVNSPQELLTLLELDLEMIDSTFPLKVPRGFVKKMKKGDINDPLLKQILPIGAETQISSDFSFDPLAEKDYNPVSGILHKFNNRVLLTLSGSCAVHCRYCFRRYFPYKENQLSMRHWETQFAYIRAHPEIIEVILSGGDPLMATNQYLTKLIQQLESIAHIKYLRIHTRLPIVLPERVDAGLLDCLKNTRFKTVMVVHCNHPQELCSDIAYVVQQLKNNNITVLNQSVLLKGVNDNVQTLSELSYCLYDHGILPYYIHLLDKVQGSQHFEVSVETTKKLSLALAAELPGFLLPRIVREEAGAPNKILFV